MLAAMAWPPRRLAWIAGDRLAALGGPLRRGADVVRWPFERALWAVERGALWPLQERLAGWGPPRRGAGVIALTGIAAAAVLAAALLLPAGSDAPRERVALPTRVAIESPGARSKAEKSREPVLQGASPSFGVGNGVGVATGSEKTSAGVGDEPNAGGSAQTAATSNEASPSAGAAATASGKKPVPAGPAAMRVARRFAEAFVFYEIGKRRARAKTVFGETATPRLAEALGERPPRQPEAAKVPKARVLNLVPGPRAGKAYTVSVSLLRVGLTTELRLELSKKKGKWVITDVRG